MNQAIFTLFYEKNKVRTSQVALVVNNLPANAGDIRDVWSLDQKDSPGGEHGNKH